MPALSGIEELITSLEKKGEVTNEQRLAILELARRHPEEFLVILTQVQAAAFSTLNPDSSYKSEAEKMQIEINRIISIYVDGQQARVSDIYQRGLYEALLPLQKNSPALVAQFIREKIVEAAKRADPVWRVKLLVELNNVLENQFSSEASSTDFEQFPEVRKILLGYIRAPLKLSPKILSDQNFRYIMGRILKVKGEENNQEEILALIEAALE